MGLPAELGRARPEPHCLLSQARGHGRPDVLEELSSVEHQLKRLHEKTGELAVPCTRWRSRACSSCRWLPMPLLKLTSGHTSCKGVYRYLTKNGRVLPPTI